MEGWPYEVSDRGRVRRIRDEYGRGSHKRPLRPWFAGGNTTHGQSGRPYAYVRLSDEANGRRKSALVHRLVALAWLPEPPPGKDEVDHIDGDHENNAASNLEWVSGSENRRRYREDDEVDE